MLGVFNFPSSLGMEAAEMSVINSSASDKCFSRIRDLADGLCGMIEDAAKCGEPLYDTERRVLQRLLEMGRHAVDGLLALQGDGDLGEHVETDDGRTLKRSDAPAVRQLRSVFGEHSFPQYVYSIGAHQKIELRPIDARLGLSPRVCSYFFEEIAQLFCIESAFRQSAENLHIVLGQRISVNTLETISHHMGADAKAFTENYPMPPAEEEAALLVATLDAKGVPLIQSSPATVKAFETRRLRPGNRRMATLAGVYSVDRHIRTPEQIVAGLFRDEPAGDRTKRPTVMFKELTAHFPEIYGDDADSIHTTGAMEASLWMSTRVQERRQESQPLVILGDGDHCLWSAVAESLAEHRVEILDIVHVSSYVWAASGLLCASQGEREKFTRTRLLTILNGGVKSVVRGLRHMGTRHGLKGASARELTRITNYLESHAHRMRYDEYLKEGYPIATGVIEGACRHMVKDRMERSGMRWTLDGAKAMLNVRAVHESGYWEQFHSTRRSEEAKKTHPHRQLLGSYVPSAMAC